MMKKTYIRRLLLPVMLVIVLAVGLTLGISAASVEQNTITSIQLNKNKTDIQVTVQLTKEYVKENKSSTLYLFELLPYQSTSQINELEPVAEFKAAEKKTVNVAYINGNANRLYSKFLVAEKQGDGSYGIITSAKYIENLELLCENTEAYPENGSKKGLQIQMNADAQLLGVRHTTINIELNDYILGENSDAALSFVYNGQTYYLNKSLIAALDHRVRVYSEAGINVYFNIILTAPSETASAAVRSFYYDGISADAGMYALNTRSETAMKNFQAFMDYLASRYTRSDHAYGFVPNFILGFEVNSNRVSNNAGPMEMSSMVYSYCTAFRVAYTAMASHYSEGRVYISLGNNFCAASSDLTVTADAMYDYPAKDFLDVFSEAIKNSGDIPWGVSINPYPSDPTMTQYWNDTYAEDNYSTPFITMKNIGVLTRYLAQEQFLYNGGTRSVIIGEFGISGDPSDETSMTMQAAAYALAYYTAAQNEDIDAFIYYRHVDHAGESEFCGLWSNVSGSVADPSAKKPLYNVFSLIDTEQSEEATSFVKQTVGSGAFSLFMSDNVKYTTFNQRTITEGIRVEKADAEKKTKDYLLFDLTEGSLCGFYPSDSVDYVELRPLDDADKTMLYAKITGVPDEYKGISNLISEEDAFKDAQYITLRVMVAAPADVSTINVMLRLQDYGYSEADAAVYEGEVQLKPNEWQDVSFKIKDFLKLTDENVDVMKLWVLASDSIPVSGEYGIWLESVTLHTKSGVSVLGVILWILLILVVLAVGGYIALYIRAQRIRRQRREARRRQQMAMAAMQQTRVMNLPPNRPQYPNGYQPPRNQGGNNPRPRQ
ncbi:MAG: hypothetical protein IJ493_11205 [Clostridia bacterium]|nr:hypothetical protein [Clostridia bacterium]